ncbi:response regulator receiver modulated metal dependent phosphohydrolase [Candidatus Magnetobacterium bavaricum]|uniref:Response regulator receiver modulated metal dependent phosphohydrolase n=1 Tax=Candidatus Magnetobacterium bavaricum TaxID=29290 RepID=A0A0F3GR68_9BACT|nr:response regulator receiver modulated metal dependent phosphohydrolase [Candidatus Magnetobacterium bavaricum]
MIEGENRLGFVQEAEDDELSFSDDAADDSVVQTNGTFWKVMVVDDDLSIHDVTKIALRDFQYNGKAIRLMGAFTGKEATELIGHNPDIALIILDVVMEDDNAGLRVAKYIRDVLKNKAVRIILRTGQPGSAPERSVIIEYDINDYKTKSDLTVDKLFSAVITSLRSYTDIVALEKANIELANSISLARSNLDGVLQAMALTLEKRDPYTAGHQLRVRSLSYAIAKEMGLSDQVIEQICFAAALHDIGKITVPTDILNKPGKITNPEFELIKEHVENGYEILKKINFPWPIADIVRQHHEKINGSGYPLGLKGDEVLLEARVICVADVVEAICSHRPYRPARDISYAIDELNKNKAVTYDTAVVEAAIRVINSGYKLHHDGF